MKYVPVINNMKKIHFDKIYNKVSYNLMDAKYQQMAFQSVPITLLIGI